MTRLQLILCLCFWATCCSARGEEAATFRTDDNPDPKLPWFQLIRGEFPPEGSAHYFAGELISVDHLQRSFILRVDLADKQNRSHFDLPVSSTMLPYGTVYYHDSPAALRDISIGTHLHGWFYVKGPDDTTKPLDESNSWTFAAPRDAFTDGAVLDLRYLNEDLIDGVFQFIKAAKDNGIYVLISSPSQTQ